MTRGIAQGRRAALTSTLGVCAGYVAHTLLAVLGLTAVLYASEILFNIVRYAGAAYLMYLGIKTLRSGARIELVAGQQARSKKQLFLTGMLTSLSVPDV
jgi:threonine/homoserine/homoserine lactone efflux protein